MTAQRGLILAALLSAVAGGGFSWRSVERRRHDEAAVAASHIARRTAEAAQQAAAARLRAAQERQALALTEIARLTMKAKKSAGAETPVKSPPSPAGFSPIAAISQDPRLQNLFMAAERARLGPTYGPLFRQLGWHADRMEKFQDILIRRTERDMDLAAVAQLQGLRPNDPVFAAVRAQGEKEIDAAVAQLLGPTDYQAWRDYERTVGVRGVVQNFVGAAALEGMPLSAAQAEQFAQILARASPAYQKGDKADYGALDWAAVDAQLPTVFSGPQLELYRQIEPLGGGASRFGALLSSTFSEAIMAEKARRPASKPGG